MKNTWTILFIMLVTVLAGVARPFNVGGKELINVADGTETNSAINLGQLNKAASDAFYATDSSVVVQSSTNAVLRYVELVTAYTQAKTLTPGGVALSVTNRAAVVIPSGVYDAGTNTLVLDLDYVDLLAMSPVAPPLGLIQDLNVTSPQTEAAPYSWTPTTLIEGSGDIVIQQTVDDIRLIGFGIVNLAAGGRATLQVDSSGSGTNSMYESMYFHAKHPGGAALGGSLQTWFNFPSHTYGVGGSWKNCRVDQNWFARCYQRTDTDTFFTAKMVNCHFGQWSVGGDFNETSIYTHAFRNAYFDNCTASHYSFGSCSEWGLIIEASTTFIDCRAGWNAYGLGTLNEGTFIRCRGGNNAFAGTTDSDWPGNFAGYAIDCQGGRGSFGGANSPVVNDIGKLTGTLINCTITNNTTEIRCEGATIDRCFIELDGAHPGSYSVPVLNLLDDNTVVRSSTILQTATGGVAIDSDAPRNVIVQNCSLTGDELVPTGLGENVNNLTLVSGNSILFNDNAPVYNYYIYPDSTSVGNGDAVSDMMDLIISRANTTTGATYRLHLYQGSYHFNFGDTVPITLDSRNNLEVIGFPEPAEKSISHRTGITNPVSYYPVIITNYLDTVMASSAVTNGQRLVYRNINLYSDYTYLFHVSDMTLDNCRLGGRVFNSLTSGEYAEDVLFKNCDIVGLVGGLKELYLVEDCGLLNAHFEKVFVSASGYINAIPATNTVTYFSEIWATNAPAILYTKLARSAGGPNDTTLEISDCYLISSGLFDDDVLNSNAIHVTDTTFFGTGAGADWDVLPELSTFINCRGVPFEFTNSASVMWCTDENGDTIFNKVGL